ncbi:hypothetical protein LZ31DRAFT_601386 [Colletotrichum somersetense]|nr:hypothetical protein LZ31DRAFT_601386 [Colletotrichum somersetense]
MIDWAGGIFFTSLTTLFLVAVSSGGIEFAWDSPGMLIYGQLYYVLQFFILVKRFSPVNTGLALFPVMFTLVPGLITTGVLVIQTNNYRYPI